MNKIEQININLTKNINKEILDMKNDISQNTQTIIDETIEHIKEEKQKIKQIKQTEKEKQELLICIYNELKEKNKETAMNGKYLLNKSKQKTLSSLILKLKNLLKDNEKIQKTKIKKENHYYIITD